MRKSWEQMIVQVASTVPQQTTISPLLLCFYTVYYADWCESRNRASNTDMKNYIPYCPAKLPDNIRVWATEMRRCLTDAELLLWQLLRDCRVAGARFKRQQQVGRYILDFYCDEKKLAIELDHDQHTSAANYDEHRDAWLRLHGIHVLRFESTQVLRDTEAVIEMVYNVLLFSSLISTLIPVSDIKPPLHDGRART